MKIQKDVQLAPFTTYKIGGPARYFVAVKNDEDVRDALRWAQERNIEYFILGGGSNVLIPDDGYNGLIIHIQATSYKLQANKLVSDAGVAMEELIEVTVSKGLAGFEWAGGLPGTLGGAIRGNAGAFGGEIKDTIVSVRALTPDGEIREFSRGECDFGYRTSIFKEEPGYIILGATFTFTEGNKQQLRSRMNELIEWRQTKHPMEYGNCGSVFKRIDVGDVPRELFERYPDMKGAIRNNQVATAYFVDQCGLKKKRVGGAEVSEKHPNFLVNASGTARAEDIIMLAGIVKSRVLNKFGIRLEEEPEFLS